MLYNTPRAATVIAVSNCILWSLDRLAFNKIIKDSSKKKREKYESILRSVEIFKSMEDYEIMQICDALKSSTYSDGDYIIKQGEMGDVFYVIENGMAYASISTSDSNTNNNNNS